MLRLALLFLVIALAVGLLGLSGVALLSVAVARALFIVFLVLFVVALLGGTVWGKPSDTV